MATQDHRSLATASRIPLVGSRFGFLVDAQFGNTTVKSLLDTSTSDSKVECKSLNKDAACLADGSPGSMKVTVGTTTTPAEVTVSLGSKNGFIKVVPDGVLGLGPESVLPLKSFSISYNETDSNNNFMTIDSVDEKLIKDNRLVSEKFDVVDGRWTIASRAVQFDSDDAFSPCSSDSDACFIEVDSGSRTIGIPSSLGFAEHYLKQCKQTSQIDGYEYRHVSLYSCLGRSELRLPTISIGVGGHVLSLEPRQYVSRTEFGTIEVHIEETDDEWILGQPLLSKYYTHFDVQHQELTVYCEEGVTCEARELQAIAPPPSRTSTPSPAIKFPTPTSGHESGRTPVILIICILKATLLSLLGIIKCVRKHEQEAAAAQQQELPYHQQPQMTSQKPVGN